MSMPIEEEPPQTYDVPMVDASLAPVPAATSSAVTVGAGIEATPRLDATAPVSIVGAVRLPAESERTASKLVAAD